MQEAMPPQKQKPHPKWVRNLGGERIRNIMELIPSSQDQTTVRRTVVLYCSNPTLRNNYPHPERVGVIIWRRERIRNIMELIPSSRDQTTVRRTVVLYCSNPTLRNNYPHPQRVGVIIWRREWDSNPRWVAPSLVFKTSSLNRSDISPCVLNDIISNCKSQAF